MYITFYSLTDYNAGKLYSETFDLTFIDTHEDLLEAIRDWLTALTETLGDNELREEYIVCYSEYIPSTYVGEWSLEPEFFEYKAAVEEHSVDIVDAAVALGIPLDKVEDAYEGEYDSNEDLAYECIESTEMLPEYLKGYLDYAKLGSDLAMDYLEHNGHYFRNNW